MTAARLMLEGYLERLSAVSRRAAEHGIDAVVIAPSPDMVYLMGYDPMQMERPTLLIVRPGREPSWWSPSWNAPSSPTPRRHPASHIVGWRDSEDPYAIVASALAGARSDRDRATRPGRRTARLAACGPRRSLRTGLTADRADLRAVKAPDELAALRRAARGADEAFRQICTMKFQGRREEEVAADLADLLVQNGHARAEFTIVASGPNAASPHHEPTGRTILPRDAVVMDFGGELGGYFSDTTRTVVVGEPPQGFERVYDDRAASPGGRVRRGAARVDVPGRRSRGTPHHR